MYPFRVHLSHELEKLLYWIIKQRLTTDRSRFIMLTLVFRRAVNNVINEKSCTQDPT